MTTTPVGSLATEMSDAISAGIVFAIIAITAQQTKRSALKYAPLINSFDAQLFSVKTNEGKY